MLCIQFLPTANVDGAKEADRGGIVKAREKMVRLRKEIVALNAVCDHWPMCLKNGEGKVPR
jgi:hypothetical protein